MQMKAEAAARSCARGEGPPRRPARPQLGDPEALSQRAQLDLTDRHINGRISVLVDLVAYEQPPDLSGITPARPTERASRYPRQAGRCGASSSCSRYRQSRCWLAAALPCLSGTQAVVEVNDAASEPALIQELELRTDVVWQCALARHPL
jgi:hypothetical protein